MSRAAIYARISEDRSGEAAGVERQLKDCRTLAQLRGLTVVGEFKDNDLSAWSGKPRPGWDAVLKLAREGEIDAVVAWHPDRLYRIVDELVEIRKLFKRKKVVLHTVQTGDVDFANANDKLHAVITAAFGEYESDHKSDRITRAHLEKAIGGGWKGGRRAWGYQPDGMTVYQLEADAIKEAARMVLAGQTMKAAADRFNELTEASIYRQVVEGKKRPAMSNRVLRDLLIGHRIVGKRVHVTQEARRDFLEDRRSHTGDKPLQPPWIRPAPEDESKWPGAVYDALWPAILDVHTWNRLRVKLLSPEQLARRGKRPQKSMLGGLLKCGECFKTPRPDGSPNLVSMGYGGHSYTCIECKSVAISIKGVEKLLIEKAGEKLADLRLQDAPDPEAGVPSTAAKREELEQRKATVRVWFRQGRLSAKEAEEDLADLERQLAELDADQEQRSHVADIAATMTGMPELWEEATAEEKGQLIRLMVAYVRVDKFEQRTESGGRIREGRRFYPGRCWAQWLWEDRPERLGDDPAAQRKKTEAELRRVEAEKEKARRRRQKGRGA